MLLHLAEQLDVSLRDRNHMPPAAGHERPIDAPEMAPRASPDTARR
jgi:hypothetical protein